MAIAAAAGYDFLVDAEPSVMLIGPKIVTIVIVVAVVLLAAGTASLASAIGVLAHKSWGRWLGIVAAVLGIVTGLVIVISGLGPQTDTASVVIGAAWATAHGLAMVGLAAGGRHFERARS
jgi:hypothetical protein